jgi:hypothetical protein
MSNAQKQKRWRNKRNKMAREASRLKNRPLDSHIKDRIKRGLVGVSERLRCVKLLLEKIDLNDRDIAAELRALMNRLDKPAKTRRRQS